MKRRTSLYVHKRGITEMVQLREADFGWPGAWLIGLVGMGGLVGFLYWAERRYRAPSKPRDTDLAPTLSRLSWSKPSPQRTGPETAIAILANSATDPHE